MFYELILASESPRRTKLLKEAGLIHRVDSVKVSETIEKNVNIEAAIEVIAEQKARAYENANKYLKGQRILVLSADTMVVYRGQPLGKPKNLDQAREFLRLLSGQTHCVVTGICLLNLFNDQIVLAHDTTKVEFKNILDSDIDAYVKSGEPLDKAGAYGIQSTGQKFVKSISGSLSNVIGLPMELLQKLLDERKWHVTGFKSKSHS